MQRVTPGDGPLIVDDINESIPGVNAKIAREWYTRVFPGRTDPLAVNMRRAHKAVDRIQERGLAREKFEGRGFHPFLKRIKACAMRARTVEAAHRLAVLDGVLEDSLRDRDGK